MSNKFTDPYKRSGTWYKGNTHIHSTISDGGLSVDELVELYAGRGYRFLCLTDHRTTVSDAASIQKDILLIGGIEVDGLVKVEDGPGGSREIGAHLVGLYEHMDGPVKEGCAEGYEALKRCGAYRIAAHPSWSRDTVSRLAGLDGLDAIEIYKHLAHDIGYRGYALEYWDALLAAGKRLWGIASDDAHINASYPYYDGGWVVVKCPELTAGAVLRALREGAFYSSQGPELHEIELTGELLHIECSPIRKVVLFSDGRLAKMILSPGGKAVSSWDIPLGDIGGNTKRYIRAELKDECGRVAWTNPFYVAGP